MPENAPEFARQVINSNLDTTNIIESDDINGTMLDTFTKLADILSDYCGPYGKYAIISDPLHPTMEPVFTKDGINIVRAIEFMAPMQRFVKNMVAYIGQRIEHVAGDGTTSSMIITATMLREILKGLTKHNVHYTYDQFCTVFTNWVNDISKFYDDEILTIDKIKKLLNCDDPTAIGYIAKSQAYTSSHGDEEITNAIEEMFSAVPPEGWGYISFDREQFETTKRIKVDIDKNQYSLQVAVFNKKVLNAEMGVKYSANHGDLLVVNTDFNQSNTIMFSRVNQVMEEHAKQHKPLIIVTHSVTDASVQLFLNSFIDKYPTSNLGIFTVLSGNMLLNHLVGLGLCGGLTFRQMLCEEDELPLIEDVSVEYKDGCLTINNLYDNPENKGIHPFVGDSNHPEYNKYLEELKANIKQITNDPGVLSAKQLTEFKKIYNKLYLTRRVAVKIGGNSHDNAAMMDVVNDCLASVKASLTKGFVSGGNRTLLKVLNKVNDYQITTSREDALYSIITDAAIKAIKQVHVALLKYAPDDISLKHAEFFDILTNTYSSIKNIDRYPLIIQPANIDIDMLKRFAEVAFKFINCNRIVIPGAVLLNKESKNDNSKD